MPETPLRLLLGVGGAAYVPSRAPRTTHGTRDVQSPRFVVFTMLLLVRPLHDLAIPITSGGVAANTPCIWTRPFCSETAPEPLEDDTEPHEPRADDPDDFRAVVDGGHQKP